MTAIIPGLFIAVVGAVVAIRSYMRWFIDSSDPRPGMMALVCGLSLLALGIAISLVDLRSAKVIRTRADVPLLDPVGSQATAQWRLWYSAAITLGAIVGFALLVGPLGLASAITVVCVSIATLAPFKSIIGFLCFIAGLICFVYLVFILGLQLPMKVLL